MKVFEESKLITGHFEQISEEMENFDENKKDISHTFRNGIFHLCRVIGEANSNTAISQTPLGNLLWNTFNTLNNISINIGERKTKRDVFTRNLCHWNQFQSLSGWHAYLVMMCLPSDYISPLLAICSRPTSSSANPINKRCPSRPAICCYHSN